MTDVWLTMETGDGKALSGLPWWQVVHWLQTMDWGVSPSVFVFRAQLLLPPQMIDLRLLHTHTHTHTQWHTYTIITVIASTNSCSHTYMPRWLIKAPQSPLSSFPAHLTCQVQPAWVVFEQQVLQSVPPSTHPHHDPVTQQLQQKEATTITPHSNTSSLLAVHGQIPNNILVLWLPPRQCLPSSNILTYIHPLSIDSPQANFHHYSSFEFNPE